MYLASEPRRLEIEVHFDRQPIVGRLYAEQGELVRPFSGWIGLMAAIRAAGGDELESQRDASPLDDPGAPGAS